MTTNQKLSEAAENRKLLLAAKCIRFMGLENKGHKKTSEEWDEYLKLECEIEDCS
tara:strand:- start:496 stop:660 length:165 start_codon:yes stop_codon:yes gene_type:complete